MPAHDSSRALMLVSLTLGIGAPTAAWAHSVVLLPTGARVSPATVELLDPQGGSMPGAPGTDTRAGVGDILTYVIQFTPVRNGASHGAGGYLTAYVPTNTEVVGVRIIDRDDNTLAPSRGPKMDDGWGPRGRHNGFDSMGLQQGSLSQVYADTGIFYSADSRTMRSPNNAFLTVLNGIELGPVPTGAGQLDNLFGFAGPPFYSHNQWDFAQAGAYGASAGSVVSNGVGNTPFGYGSAVAGPLSHYAFEKVSSPGCSNAMDDDFDGFVDYPSDVGCANSLDDDETAAASARAGPWQRIRYAGSETGAGSATDCQSCQGVPLRVGVPTDLGWGLSADNPLPAGTNAVRFSLGELVVGDEYFAEVSLRVKALPLDPAMTLDVVCVEVFGGDAAMPQGGQDNAWRYHVPAAACVSLNLYFDLGVDKVVSTMGDTLTFTISGKNLSVNPQTNVVVTDTFVPADLAFVATTQGPAPIVVSGTMTWPTMNLQPGQEYTFQWQMTATGSTTSSVNRATYTSDQVAAPGYSVMAVTDIGSVAILRASMFASTSPATTPPKIAAGGIAHLHASVQNAGTGSATTNAASFLSVVLPAGFSFCSTAPCGAAQINGVNVANPAISGQTLTFTAGLATIPAGGATTLDLDVVAVGSVAPGLYTSSLQVRLRDSDLGRDVETSVPAVAPVLVGIDRSEPPVIDEPVLEGTSTITGVTSEGQGATVVVYVNGNSVAPVLAGPGGVFTAVVPTAFVGQHFNATAQAPAEVASLRSTPDAIVQSIAAACGPTDTDGDGLGDICDVDDDADGLTDAVEVSVGTNPLLFDSDSDGVGDGDEVNTYGTNPLDADSDDDAALDGSDNCRLLANPTQANGDRDALGDACDNCRSTTNPDQLDVGGLASTTPDGVGDRCQNADFNQDGNVNLLDVTLLRRSLAGSAPELDPRMPPEP